MLNQIIVLLLQVGVGLVAGTCLLRAYMQYQRVPLSARSGNPLGPFIFALTDWLVLPLRRAVRPVGRWDSASLVGAYLLELAQFTVLWLLAGDNASPLSVPALAAFGLLRLVLSGLSGLVIVYAVLSWVQADSAMSSMASRLVGPLLQPIRRFVPLAGGVDLSPLVLLVLLQVAVIVAEAAQSSLFA